MSKFHYEDALAVLDKLDDLYAHSCGFVSAEFHEEGRIAVGLRDVSYKLAHSPSSMTVWSSLKERNYDVPVEYKKDAEKQTLLGDSRLHPPIEPVRSNALGMGGDMCRNVRSPFSYGTVAFYASAASFGVGGCGSCSAVRVLLSNNHVIGLSDAGVPGDAIWTPLRDETARLKCNLSLKCGGATDLSIAKVVDMSGVAKHQVRDLGKVKGVRMPRLGEKIRKYGARTGVTAGKVKPVVSVIRVGKFTYRGVFKTNGGFGCPGDSGSAVLGKDKSLLGILSWGDQIDCAEGPSAYFWPIVGSGISVTTAL